MDNEAETINTIFLMEFECPICKKYILPPIRQCTNGHTVCQDCFTKIRKCAICRSPKSELRPIALERVQSLLTFPCVYKEEGCEFRALCADVAKHQKECKFSWMPCPLRFNGCTWQGEKSNVNVHCKSQHSQNIFFSSKQKFLSSKFRDPKRRVYYIIFYVFNNLFRCTWDLDEGTGLIRFAVYLLGKPVGGKFAFEMSYLVQDQEMITIKAPCYLMEDDSEMFLSGKYFILHHELVKNFCDVDGDLSYSVNIIQKECGF